MQGDLTLRLETLNNMLYPPILARGAAVDPVLGGAGPNEDARELTFQVCLLRYPVPQS